MWYRQLLAESIGKNMTTDGTTFPHQLLPTVSTSVDLHSMAQLYLGGYKGMVTHFIYGDIESDHHKFADHWILSHMKQLEGHTPLEIKNIIRESVLKAYNDQRLPYLYTKLPKITAFEIGYFMASEMFTVMVLGALLHVDVFNQPNVEDYKRHIREALAK
jgi:glucose-6-phosphate isomerase